MPNTNLDTAIPSAWELHERGRLAEALVAFEKIRAERIQDIVRSTAASADILFQLDRLEEAERLYNSLLGIYGAVLQPANQSQHSAPVYIRLGEIARCRGDLEHARAHFDKACSGAGGLFSDAVPHLLGALVG